MNTATKLSAYGAALVLVFAGAWAAGAAAGPLTVGAGHEPGSHAPGDAAPRADTEPDGLASSRDGHTLSPERTTFTPGVAEEFAFRVTGSDGAAVTSFDEKDGQRMHVVVVRRDGTAYQYLHPQLSADGVWRVSVTLPAAGSYRAFADFVPRGGRAVVLGVDLQAPGPYNPIVPFPTRTAQVDGYRVELTGDLRPGQTSQLTVDVSRDGRPVTDLQPHLGAYGHLVALRQGDLAYVRVRPDGAPGDGRTAPGPRVVFSAEVPTAGTYRLFLDFRHGDAVRTAEFTVATREESATPPPPAGADGDGGQHSDQRGDEHGGHG
ncbi:hypothetical protein LX15_001461 [Streptoalloteichus tenebrarius]|uniref:Secreted protein n=1 Tax=Streptoalloteichus tenebrarius (strain ATCC 17920 / DSM 40477 / JCM 4838 / CBS 697.72 / NBRC 16177 / NCIMB 11028 / NRRL B-12390 / A12253. 1 / ISP 5477) TaxID=1933 RepID=A0ABT1HQJ3_STRSD|nr:hypothetical protein [Streptoalloteichus tenebrarius]MCP2257775.1 hypothetical protein [Streptoalloteichus tenebrarius]BFE99865.1 hypothetical protein GCM10020241_15410 [Streptoalloteichus tenebrarius]